MYGWFTKIENTQRMKFTRKETYPIFEAALVLIVWQARPGQSINCWNITLRSSKPALLSFNLFSCNLISIPEPSQWELPVLEEGNNFVQRWFNQRESLYFMKDKNNISEWSNARVLNIYKEPFSISIYFRSLGE